MLFNSLEFALFLPIVFALYWLISGNLKLQNLFVVAASYVFYGWWNWRFLLLIAFTSLCSWVSGLIIEKLTNKGGNTRWVCCANIVVNISVLCIFKYYNFFVTSFADAFLGGNTHNMLLNVVLPVGISFYTFQALSYTIDVYKGKLPPTHDVVQFFAYVSFFPQLVAGPIERATNLLPQFANRRAFCYADAVDGCRQILWGLFKKIVVADNCAIVANDIFGSYSSQPANILWVGALFFSFQIYGDFSGYSDIAIGTAKLFGIKLMRNFKTPYFSRDIAEFWRCWHISLTTWFRDYIYSPLGGSRVSKIKVVRNTFVIFLVSGIWHGANWTFVVWGVFHALLFLPLIMLGLNRKYLNNVAENRLLPSVRELFQMLTTFLLTVIGWVIFRAESISQAFDYLKNMFASGMLHSPIDFFNYPETWVAYFVIFMLIIEWLNRSRRHGLDLSIGSRTIRWIIYLTLAVSIFAFKYNVCTPFVYFQF